MKIFPALLWTILVYWLCLLPASKLPKSDFLNLIYFDKIAHFIFYSIILILYLWGLGQWKNKVVASIIICLSCGVSIEFLQAYLPLNRTFDFWDIMANVMGLSFTLFYLKIRNGKIGSRSIL